MNLRVMWRDIWESLRESIWLKGEGKKQFTPSVPIFQPSESSYIGKIERRLRNGNRIFPKLPTKEFSHLRFGKFYFSSYKKWKKLTGDKGKKNFGSVNNLEGVMKLSMVYTGYYFYTFWSSAIQKPNVLQSWSVRRNKAGAWGVCGEIFEEAWGKVFD